MTKMKVCIGGTFNVLHKGHRSIIDKAFEVAGKNGSVFIGLATGKLVERKIITKPLESRKKALEEYLTKKGFINRSTIKSIEDKYGPSIDEDFDAIVVSPETIKTAEEINNKRIQKGKKPLKIIQVPFVLAKDGKPISSTRIINKEIDEKGDIL
jgi:pantetheine-phosphate adenylyltransferase